MIVANNIAYVTQIGILEGTRYLSDRVVLIDVSDPWNPIKLGEYNHTSYRDLGGIDVAGNKIYVIAAENLIIIDARDLSNPIKAGEFEFGMSNLACPNIDVVGDIAYIAGGTGGLHIISVKNSSQPVKMGGFDTAGWAIKVAVAEDIAYVTKWEEGLAVLNVRDPTSPVKIGQYRSGDMLIDVSVIGDVAYVTHIVRSEGSGYQPIIDSGLIALDISDPSNPKEIGRYTGMDDATDVFATAGIVYATEETRGLQIFEVSQVSRPLLKSPESPDNRINWDAVGVFILAISGGIGLIFFLIKRYRFTNLLDKVDNTYSKFKMEPHQCEKELNKLRDVAFGKLAKIDAQKYNILCERIDCHLRDLREVREQSEEPDGPAPNHQEGAPHDA